MPPSPRGTCLAYVVKLGDRPEELRDEVLELVSVEFHQVLHGAEARCGVDFVRVGFVPTAPIGALAAGDQTVPCHGGQTVWSRHGGWVDLRKFDGDDRLGARSRFPRWRGGYSDWALRRPLRARPRSSE